MEIAKLKITCAILWRRIRSAILHPIRLLDLYYRLYSLLRIHGVRGLFERYVQDEELYADYGKWLSLYDIITDQDRLAIREQIVKLNYQPIISVVMVTCNTPEKLLRCALDSVCNQLYPNLEICIADNASSTPHIKYLLEQYQDRDKRIKVIFLERNQAVSSACNRALGLASGKYITLLNQHDELSEHALYYVVMELNAYRSADLIYSDEDKIYESQGRNDPYFKPDWNPLLLHSQNYVSNMVAWRASLVKDIGGFREVYEGAHEWDFIIRIVEKIPADHIRHIPHILYHKRDDLESAGNEMVNQNPPTEIEIKVIHSHFERMSREVEIVPLTEGRWRIKHSPPNPAPLVSLIIPTRNGFNLLSNCVESIYKKTIYRNFEIIIVDNQSADVRTLEYLKQLQDKQRARVLRYDAPFNYSAINNLGVLHSKGEIIGLINNDIEVISPDWLDEMVSYAVQREVGAVGAMLYYPNDTIQHAGAILGVHGVANHIYANHPRCYSGQRGRALLPQNLSVMTGACLVLRRAVYDEAGGMDERLPVTFNDTDLCLRIIEKGYKNVWTPFAELYHHESASRGYDDSAEKQARYQCELEYLQRRWGSLLVNDPAYNPNLSLERTAFTLAFPPRLNKPWRSLM